MSWSLRELFGSLRDGEGFCGDVSSSTLRGSCEIIPGRTIRACIEASVSEDKLSNFLRTTVSRFICDLCQLFVYCEGCSRGRSVDHDSIFASEIECV